MADIIDVNLVDVDLSYRLPPPGDYTTCIDSYLPETNTNGSLKDIKWEFTLLKGPEEGVGLKLFDRQDPNHEIGKKKMKQMALACGVEFTTKGIDLSAFIGRSLKIRVVHKPGKEEGQIFANISKFLELEPPV